MLLVLEPDVADLAATRFAISPLGETIRAVQLLAGHDAPAVNAPWVRWARRELVRPALRLPRLWPLAVNGLPNFPEFLVPARGAATVWEGLDPEGRARAGGGREEAAEALLGAPRVRLLTALRSPATTTALGLALLGDEAAGAGASAS